MQIRTINPATEEEINQYDLFSESKIQEIINDSQFCFKKWRKVAIEDRAILMNKVADVLEENKKKYATVMTAEMGKTIASSIAEVEKCAWVCRYYAKNAREFLADKMVATDASKSYVSYQPLGIVLAVMPWNFPLWQVFRYAAPVLMAGNVALLKHASNVPECGILIEDIFNLAGFPTGAFSNLLIHNSQVELVINDSRVVAASVTGSEFAGASISSYAGSKIKKTVLELGGSDAYIILEDADLEQATKQCTFSRLLNSGQSCIGAKRFIVVDAVYDSFLDLFTKEMSNSTFGDPLTGVTMGPLARKDLRNEVHQQVLKSVEHGATLHLGGKIPSQIGFYYPATILTNVKPGMPAYSEEIFGPVASVIRVANEEEAIAVANDSRFGLGSCIFTEDVEKGERIAKYEIEAGSCFVNQFVKSDPRLPFGGIKASGFGRELSSFGIHEFVNAKTVYIK